ncbi:branched-chain amino acid ABC transporter permease [Castellaniella sp.]|uniref:branched-chain amino acid ABC transporter permease n=1 Tax=Castellaniella sp. TaxID=1955812 RepID=UPI003562A313
MDPYFLIDTAQSLMSGMLYGSTYALIGLGFTLIFGVMHKIDLTYAATSIGGAYASILVLQSVSAPAIVVFLLAACAGGLIGLLVYFACFHFISSKHPLAMLMATLGMLLFIEEVIIQATDGVPISFPVLVEHSIMLGEFYIRGDLIAVFLVACVCMAGLLWLLHRTRLGLGTRAVAQQPTAAMLCGINLAVVNSQLFIITGLLGGVAGAMIGSAVGALSPLLTLPLTVKGLVVTVIGGLGSIPGAIIAGLFVGGLENVFQHLRGVSERDLYVMLLLFIFLVVRPNGLFGSVSARD